MRRSLLAALLVGLLALVASIGAAATWGGPPVQSLTIRPSHGDFPATNVGATTPKEFTIEYPGKGNSGSLSTSVQGAGFDFSTNTCDGVTLSAKNSTCAVTITFTPLAATTYSGTLTVSGRKVSGSATFDGTGQNPSPPSLSIIDAPYVFSNSPPPNNIVVFTVTMSKTSTTAVTFDWAATDAEKDTAYWGSSCDGSADYTSPSQTGSGTIAAEETTTTIQFGTCTNGPANGDPNTTPTYFTVTISNPSNGATITNDTGLADIRIS